MPSKQVPRAASNLEHEVEQIVGLLISLAQASSSPRPVRLVEHHRAVSAFEQLLALIGIVEDQPRRHDGNL